MIGVTDGKRIFKSFPFPPSVECLPIPFLNFTSGKTVSHFFASIQKEHVLLALALAKSPALLALRRNFKLQVFIFPLGGQVGVNLDFFLFVPHDEVDLEFEDGVLSIVF